MGDNVFISRQPLLDFRGRILRQGILPFYGTAASHLASQRTALAAGFLPAWAELAAEAAED